MRAKNVPLGIVALVFFLAFLWFVPEFQGKYFSQGAAPEDMPMLVNEYRRTWAQILFGFFVLLGLYFTWRRVEISQKTLETQQDQQVTERFTRAIDQLGQTDDKGNKKLEIRLGGIYALERIARDSPERDFGTVMEILTAYVRANASYSTDETLNPGTVSNEQEEPPADIRAILDVIGRRNEDRVPEKSRVHIDLRRTNLARINLDRANLEGANLNDADLRRANFADTNFRSADFQRADLRGSNLNKADLREALLASADLVRTFLLGANLYKANFYGAKLERTILVGADLRGASFEEVEGLTQEQLEQTFGDADTILPEGSTRPASWTTGTDEQADEDE